MRGVGRGLHLTMQINKETISVHVGLVRFLENQDIEILPQDTIEVTGSRVTFNGKPALIAAQIKKGEKVLQLRDERKHEEETKTRKEHRIERSYGRFARSFTLPDEVDAVKVTAEFRNGLLTVHMPKGESARPKVIDVKVA
jgi:hypothetical protein